VTVTPAAPDTKTFATCDIGEAPAFVFTEDDGVGPTFTTGQDGTANGAIILNPSDTTKRGTMTKTFATDQDFSVYDGGTAATDNDFLELYVYTPDPNDVLAIDVMVDVNSSSTNAFQDDYYFGSFQSGAEFLIVIGRFSWKRFGPAIGNRSLVGHLLFSLAFSVPAEYPIPPTPSRSWRSFPQFS
jgi:hypothetical protein